MSWIDCELGDVVTLKRGHDLPKDSRIEGQVPVVSSSGITGWHNEIKAEPPGVVTGRYGTIGEVFYLDRPYWPLNTALYAIDFHGNDPRFVAYFLRSQLKNYKSEKAAVPGVDRNVLHKIKVRCPDPQTQSKIVSVLSAYDDLIENNRRRIALLEQAARLLYREWFVHFRFPGHETAKFVDGLPEGWESCPIAEKFDTKSGGTPSRKREDFFQGDVNWVKTQELNEGYIRITDEKISVEAVKVSAAKIFPRMTLLMAIYGGTNIGRTGVLAEPSACNQACLGFFPKNGDDDWIYLQKWIQAHRENLISLAQGAAQTNISQKTVRGLELLWPSRAILANFYTVVKPMLLQVEQLETQVGQLTKARDLLLPRLMDGRIPVKV